MRAKQLTITADGSGNFTGSLGVPTSRLNGIWIDLDTLGVNAVFAFASAGRTILTVTHPTADTYLPVGELLDTAAGAASTSYGRGGAVVHGTIDVTVTGATANGAGSFLAFVE